MVDIQRDDLYEALSPGLLESSPQSFLENLQLCISEKIGIQNYLNDSGKEYTWYSPLPICLYYLVGDLIHQPTGEFFGSTTSINEDMGVEIMKLLLLAGADLTFRNYYNKNIYDEILNDSYGDYTCTSRRNNKKLIQFIQKYRIMNTN